MVKQAVYKRGDRFRSRALTQRADTVSLQTRVFQPCDQSRGGTAVPESAQGIDHLAMRFAVGAVRPHAPSHLRFRSGFQGRGDLG